MALILNIQAVVDHVPQPLLPNVKNDHLVTTAHTCQEVSSLSELETVHVLGKGREGTVYKVRHKNTGAVYALKVVYAAYSSNNIHDVLQEIEILGSLDSPFVVGFHGVLIEEPSGDVAILMDLMDSGTLHSLVKTNGTFSETMIAHVARQTLMGLDYLHNTKKIVHSDIKPSNLLVNESMQIKIADFGVSKVIMSSNSNSSTNDPPHFVGTIAYMSPERFDSSGYSNGSSFGAGDVFAGDVWSLGLTFMELYIGYQPYYPPGRQFTTEFDLIAEICFEDPPRLPQDASEDFQDFIRCCLHKETTNRWTAPQLLSHPFLNN